MKLVSIYRARREAQKILYTLLQERDKTINISHQRMPTWDEHKKFIASKPYQAWYLIQCGGLKVGSIYLTRSYEIGIHILRKHQKKGYAPEAIDKLINMYGPHRYLANINP